MRKVILLGALLAVGLTSCAQKEFQVNGTVSNPDLNGGFVYLMDNMTKEAIAVDSAVIAEGVFSIKGIADNKVTNLKIKGRTYPIAKEEGIITFSPATRENPMVQSGTPMNTAFQDYNISLSDQMKELREMYAALKDQPDAETKQEAKMDEIKTYIVEYITTNAQNGFGEVTLINVKNLLDSKQKLELIEKLPAEAKAKESIVKIEAVSKGDLATAVGTKYVDVVGEDQAGAEVKLSSLMPAGKVVLVDFWASWCGPCLRSMPALKELKKDYEKKGLVIVGLSLDTDKVKWVEAIKKHDLPWSHMIDPMAFDGVGATYGIGGIPYLMLLDKEGKIVLKGNVSIDEIKAELEKLLK